MKVKVVMRKRAKMTVTKKEVLKTTLTRKTNHPWMTKQSEISFCCKKLSLRRKCLLAKFDEN
jgi:hypothetical protein